MSPANTDISIYNGLQRVEVPCRACGQPVPTHIEAGARPPIKLCNQCLNHPTRHIERSTTSTELAYVTREVTSHSLVGPVAIYRPGDEGFAERAAQVVL